MSSGGTDFDTFHRVRLPAEVAVTMVGQQRLDVGDGRTLAFQLDDSRAYTYRATGDGVRVEPAPTARPRSPSSTPAAFDDLSTSGGRSSVCCIQGACG
jgi:hypothetical protein